MSNVRRWRGIALSISKDWLRGGSAWLDQAKSGNISLSTNSNQISPRAPYGSQRTLDHHRSLFQSRRPIPGRFRRQALPCHCGAPSPIGTNGANDACDAGKTRLGGVPSTDKLASAASRVVNGGCPFSAPALELFVRPADRLPTTAGKAVATPTPRSGDGRDAWRCAPNFTAGGKVHRKRQWSPCQSRSAFGAHFKTTIS